MEIGTGTTNLQFSEREQTPKTADPRQIYRQQWVLMKALVKKGGLIRTRAGLIKDMKYIEDTVRLG